MTTVRSCGLMVLLALAACNQGHRGASPETSDPATSKPAPAVHDSAAQGAEKDGMTNRDRVLIYRIGIPGWDVGETTLRLSEDGSAVVDNERTGQPKRHFEGSVGATALGDALAAIDAAKLWGVARRATAVPDEAPVELTLLEGGQPAHQVSLWANQLGETPERQKVETMLDGFVRTVSNGDVY